MGLIESIRRVNKPLGLRAQLVSAIAITTVTAIGSLGVISLFMLYNSGLLMKVGEARALAHVLRETVFYAPADKNIQGEGVRQSLKRMMKGSGISALTLKDFNGANVFSEGDLPNTGAGVSSLYYGDGIRVQGLGDTLFDPYSYLYVKVWDVSFGEAGRSITFAVPFASAASDLARLRRLLVILAVAEALLIVLLGGYVLSYFIVKPLKKLEGTASEIAAGDLDKRAVIERDDEIGSLAKAFNSMAERLESEIKVLERTNKELFETREELLRANTLAAVGRLAAGIAHEVGNPLGAVSGYLGMLENAETSAEDKEIIVRANAEIDRITRLLREFLDMSRQPVAALAYSDTNEVVSEAVAFLSHDAAFGRAERRLELKDGLPPVIIDAEKLRQVLVNILINAAHAVEKGGSITISSGMKELEVAQESVRRRKEDTPAHLAVNEKKKFVYVAFADTGRGMSEAEAARVFEPFYTTKEQGKGTGLGLFVSQGIIKTYGGFIDVKSIEGKGSVFTVYLNAAMERRI